MSAINNSLFSNSNALINGSAPTQNHGTDKILTYIFTPSELGVSGKNPPATARVTEAQAEKALFKHFGLNADDPKDAARLKELLDTTGSPFQAVETKGGLTAVRNQKTGNYEIKSRVKAELYNNLKGTAAAVKAQVETERAQSAATSAANPNEAVAAKTNANVGDAKAALNRKLDYPAMSAREVGRIESLTRTATNALDAATGTDTNGIGATINRQAVSAIKATGKVLEAVGASETGRVLQNASSEITRRDERAETLIKQSGAQVPLIAQIGKDADKLAENALDAAETIIAGDFSDKSSTGAFAGRIIGGLNPAGDVRDIAANSKDAAEGKPGSYVGLGGAVLGTIIPGVGDAGKAVIRGNKEAIAEGAEALLKTADEAATATVKTAEEQAAEQAAKAAAERAAQVTKRYDEIAASGHAVQRHGEGITEVQLDERAMYGKDPITGTTDDAFRKDVNGNPAPHRSSKDATKFNNKEALVKAEDHVRNTAKFKNAVGNAHLNNTNSFAVDDIKLEDIFGVDYKKEVFGKTRVGSKNNPTGTTETDFTAGTIKAAFKKDASGKWNLETMYPEPKN